MRDSAPFRLAVAGGVIAIIGSLVGPFTKVGDLSANGTESGHNGTVIIVLTVISLAAIAAGLLRGKRGSSLFGLIIAGIAVLVAFLDWGDVNQANDLVGALGGAAEVEISRGWGLYVATAGTILLALGAFGAMMMGRKGPG